MTAPLFRLVSVIPFTVVCFALAAQPSTLVEVPGGAFTMGCTPGQQPCDPASTAAHPVTISRFFLATREVTQSEYALVMGGNPSANAGCAACPVENVSWYDAIRFCNKISILQRRRPCYYADAFFNTPFDAASGTVYWDTEANGYRLPTEAEWEYAARAGTDLRYAGSNTATDVGWFSANSGGKTRADTLAPNGFGFYNLSGNVEEWVWDAYEPYADYAKCDPLGPGGFGVDRVRRGGHYNSGADATVSRRTAVAPGNTSAFAGFRIAGERPGVGLGNEVVYIPPGTFTMGCTPEQAPCLPDQNPAHSVTLSGFYIGKYEVTQIEWSALMSDISPAGNIPAFQNCGADCPVETVSWYYTIVYCNRLSEKEGLEPCYYSDAGFTQVYGKSGGNWSLLNAGPVYWKSDAKGYRLPTEAEWEYAARGAGANPQTLYSGSNNIDSVAWWIGNSQGKTWPRGLKDPNAIRLFDAGGNVEEWCFDWYGANYYSTGPQVNPTGPDSGTQRVLRGGSWDGDASDARVADRSRAEPSVTGVTVIGFRLCRSANTPGCTALASPADGATNVSPMAALSWPAAAGATGYRLRVGTTPGGDDLLSDFDNGSSTTYVPTTSWATSDTIYVMIVPYKAEGPAFACSSSHFVVGGPPMVSAPQGSFTMGCTPDQQGTCSTDENPAHNVSLSPFFIAKYEVSQQEWQTMWGANPSNFIGCGPDCPIEQVSWYDAIVYCNRLSEQLGFEPCYYSNSGFTQVYGKSGTNWILPNSGNVFWKQGANGFRLPTEAEWEYAARGAGAIPQTRYSGSNNADSVAWWNGNSNNKTWPRGLKKANALGLYDMSGNVWEWCYDWYNATYYSSSPPNNPTGPPSGSIRARRGASWLNTINGVRLANRSDTVDPNVRDAANGFRLVRNAP